MYTSSFIVAVSKEARIEHAHTPTSVQSGEMEAGSVQLRLDYGFGGYWI